MSATNVCNSRLQLTKTPPQVTTYRLRQTSFLSCCRCPGQDVFQCRSNLVLRGGCRGHDLRQETRQHRDSTLTDSSGRTCSGAHAVKHSRLKLALRDPLGFGDLNQSLALGAMPQIRKAAAKDLQFSVSPWHVKQPAGESDVKQTHQETYFAVQPDQPARPAAAADLQPKAKRPVQQHANESRWQTRKKPALSDDAQQAIGPDTPQSSQEQSSDTGEDEEHPSQTGTSGAVLQGTAVLAFLPSGQLSGRPCLPT